MLARLPKVTITLAVGQMLCLAAARSAIAQSYTIIDLGAHFGEASSWPDDINADGDVVGSWTPPDQEPRPFVWLDGTMFPEDILHFRAMARATGINSAGQVVGTASSDGVESAGVWEDEVINALPALPGHAYSSAEDINDAGQIVGKSADFDNEWAVLWECSTVDAPERLDERVSAALAINAVGAVVGYTGLVGLGMQAVLWENGTAIDLETLGGEYSTALDINASGQIVGIAQTADGVIHAVLWEEGQINDLGVSPGGVSSLAYGINEHGHVVGQSTLAEGAAHAVLWRDGEMIDLWESFPEQNLAMAVAINDAGQIAVAGLSEGSFHAFLLTPDDDEEPSSGGGEPDNENEASEGDAEEPDGGDTQAVRSGSGGAGRRPGGICGLGTVLAAPIILVVLCFLRSGRRV